MTLGTPMIAGLSRRWVDSLVAGGMVSGSSTELEEVLRPLALRTARLVLAGARDDDLGRDVGLALVQRGYDSTVAIVPTVVELAEGFTWEPETARPTGWPPTDVLRRRITGLTASLAEGFAYATREHALAAQEEMQRAALAAIRASELERRTSQARFRAFFVQAAVGIGLVDMSGRVIDGNAAWGAMLGYDVEQMRGRRVLELVTPGGSPAAITRLREVLAGTCEGFRMEISHDNRHGERLHLDLSISRVHSAHGDPDFLVGVAVDITARKRLEDRLWHESRHDALTGLPNRTLFFERLDALLRRPGGHSVGVCYIDLDGFKSINDGLGHDVGDQLLVQVAERLRAVVTAPGSLLARLGGDEFGVLIDGTGADLSHSADPGAQADRLLAALAEPITIDGRELAVSASVGVVDTLTGGTDVDGLMRAADITLYLAKARGRGRWERHDPKLNADQITRHTLGTEMSAALARGEFFLEYQPLVRLTDGSIVRVEALVRWQHPRLGLLHPDSFIPMAEENGLIVTLGRWVLCTAVQAAAQWHSRFPEAGVGINVNVAVGQLYDPELATHVRDALTDCGLPAHLLHLELTESAVLGEASGPVDALWGLAAAGVPLVIDDFGTGYSNLVHLSRLPVSELKIAGSFLQIAPAGDLTNDKILPAIISLARSLELSVTAEGVETKAQADRLRDLGCDFGQGWYFARPATAQAVAGLIAAAQQPAAKQPAVQQPAAQQPAVQTPAVLPPAVPDAGPGQTREQAGVR
jgi:diguanylate cyclase (GGDEF)-like protein/PAS domain S-box-containing protein